jgi:uncharacterized membrane protein
MEDKIIFFICTYLLFAIFMSIYIFTDLILAAGMSMSIGAFYVFSQSDKLSKICKDIKSGLINEITRLMKHN